MDIFADYNPEVGRARLKAKIEAARRANPIVPIADDEFRHDVIEAREEYREQKFALGRLEKKQQVESALKRQALEKLAGYKRVTRGSEVICTIFELIEQAGLELPV
jgi:isopenicillin N synthase-like dioxygenase